MTATERILPAEPIDVGLPELLSALGPIVFGAPQPGMESQALARGASIRMRWFAALTSLPPQAQREGVAALWTPDPRAAPVLAGLASSLLGGERSLRVERAIERQFEDLSETRDKLLRRWAQVEDLGTTLVEHARLLEVTAPADVLALGWLAVLGGHHPPPAREVAEEVATALLRATAARHEVLRSVLAEELPRPAARIESHMSAAWAMRHPTLAQTALLLVGFAVDTAGVTGVRLDERTDPEDGSELAVLTVSVAADPDEARDQILARAAQCGALALQTDQHGGAVALEAAEA